MFTTIIAQGITLYDFQNVISTIQASQVALVVKNLPANAGDTRDVVRSLDQEDPVEAGMATHPRILAWRIPMDRGAWWAAVHGVATRQT